VKRNTDGNPKFMMLQATLQLPKWGAMGILEALWHFTASQAPRGDIGRWEDNYIALGMGWQKKAATLINALVKCGWVERHAEHRLVIHDWKDHADGTCDKYLARTGLTYWDGTPARCSKSANVMTCHDKSRDVMTSHDKSGQVTTCQDLSSSRARASEPVPESESESECKGPPPSSSPESPEPESDLFGKMAKWWTTFNEADGCGRVQPMAFENTVLPYLKRGVDIDATLEEFSRHRNGCTGGGAPLAHFEGYLRKAEEKSSEKKQTGVRDAPRKKYVPLSQRPADEW
jgi:hypothetical protein